MTVEGEAGTSGTAAGSTTKVFLVVNERLLRMRLKERDLLVKESVLRNNGAAVGTGLHDTVGAAAGANARIIAIAAFSAAWFFAVSSSAAMAAALRARSSLGETVGSKASASKPFSNEERLMEAAKPE